MHLSFWSVLTFLAIRLEDGIGEKIFAAITRAVVAVSSVRQSRPRLEIPERYSQSVLSPGTNFTKCGKCDGRRGLLGCNSKILQALYETKC